MMRFRMAVTVRAGGSLPRYLGMPSIRPAFHSPVSLSDPILIRSALGSLTSDNIPHVDDHVRSDSIEIRSTYLDHRHTMRI